MVNDAVKHVRVDNWGVFFLQRLQLFFSKTDYCDLTLQFEGNVQLKVHRLVMNACTEYFQYLETCQSVEENIILMPDELQADVIVPIVNFMYTGTLQFQASLFEKLYKAAEMMNITVLTKLLDAQKLSISKAASKKTSHAAPQQSVVKKAPPLKSPSNAIDLPATLPGRKLPVWKRKNVPTAAPPPSPPQQQFHFAERKTTSNISNDSLSAHDNTPKPTRFEWPDDDDNLPNLPSLNLMDTAFDDISYTSKPLLTVDYEMKVGPSFDDIKHNLRSSNVSNKKQATANLDMEEMKDYVKEQKIRSGFASYDEDEMSDSMHPFDSKDSKKRKSDKSQESSPSKKVKFADKQPQIVHTKIISEILKKYPQLVKKNKNIRLKIMAKNSKNTPIDNKEMTKIMKNPKLKVQMASPKADVPKTAREVKEAASIPTKPQEIWTCDKCSTSDDPVEFVLYYLYRKHMTDVHYEKFDPLLCKYCGLYCKTNLLLLYHLYTKHGIKPSSPNPFAKCDLCPFIALNEVVLSKHKTIHTSLERQCVECLLTFTNKLTLTSHVQITGHNGKSGKNNFHCQYCSKKYNSGINLFSHIRLQHRAEARNDGIVSIDESESDEGDQRGIAKKGEYIIPEMLTESTPKDNKVKILSNVKVAHEQKDSQVTHSQVTLEPSSEAEALSNVASGIATSLGLVDIVVLDDNQQYILQSDSPQLVTTQEGQQEYILPEITENTAFAETTTAHNVMGQNILPSSDIGSTDELVMVLTDHDYKDGQNEISNDNSNIVVLYSHPVDGQQGQFITSQGNLMVNSQTGLIEIRNGATINTTTTSSGHVVVTSTSDTHIESIEMIQREIESHNKPEDHQETVLSDMTTVAHVVTTESQPQIAVSVSEIATVDSVEMVSASDAPPVTAEDSVTEADAKEIEKQTDSNYDNAGDEVQTVRQEGDESGLVETETVDSRENLDESNTSQCLDSSQEELNASSEMVQSTTETELETSVVQEEGEREESSAAEGERPTNVDETDSGEVLEKHSAKECEAMEVDESFKEYVCEDVNRQEEVPMEDDSVSHEQSFAEEAPDTQNVEVVQEKPSDVPSNSEQDVEGHDVPPDTIDRSPPTLEIEEPKEVNEFANPEDEEPPQLEPEEKTVDQQDQENEPSKENETEPMEVDDSHEETDTTTAVTSSADQGVDEVDNSTQESEAIESKEVTVNEEVETCGDKEINKEHVDDEETPEVPVETSEKEEPEQRAEETPKCQEESQDESTGHLDDNSQSSQDSHVTEHEDDDDDDSKKSEVNHATKISILNDWDDTDSQQSGDRAEAIKAAGETVTKLVDEWEEEEEEESRKGLDD